MMIDGDLGIPPEDWWTSPHGFTTPRRNAPRPCFTAADAAGAGGCAGAAKDSSVTAATAAASTETGR